MTLPPPLLEHVLVPVASERDARTTAEALFPYLQEEDGRVTVVHVVEKAGGAPDKASVEQAEEEAKDAFEAFGDVLSSSGVPYETEIRYGTDVAETIIETAADVDASAIVFTPRGGSRWVRLLTGDVSLSLVSHSDRPVVVLPDVEDESDEIPDVEDEDAENGDGETGATGVEEEGEP